MPCPWTNHTPNTWTEFRGPFDGVLHSVKSRTGPFPLKWRLLARLVVMTASPIRLLPEQRETGNCRLLRRPGQSGPTDRLFRESVSGRGREKHTDICQWRIFAQRFGIPVAWSQ